MAVFGFIFMGFTLLLVPSVLCQHKVNRAMYSTARVSTWTEWTRWDVCTRRSTDRINAELVHRRRTCSGEKCDGDMTEMKCCCREEKKLVAEWSIWSKWSSCSSEFDFGIQTRSRKCLNEYSIYRNTCMGKSIDTKYCFRDECHNAPIEGYPGTWLSWSSCSRTCGFGVRTRKRECLYEASIPNFMKKPCPPDSMQQSEYCSSILSNKECKGSITVFPTKATMKVGDELGCWHHEDEAKISMEIFESGKSEYVACHFTANGEVKATISKEMDRKHYIFHCSNDAGSVVIREISIGLVS